MWVVTHVDGQYSGTMFVLMSKHGYYFKVYTFRIHLLPNILSFSQKRLNRQ